MNCFELSKVGDAALRRDMVARVPNTRRAIALTVAEVAEFDARKLYVPEGFPSMVEFCMSELGFTRQSALKTIRVGRVAREFPEIFHALADGRLNRTAVILLATVLTRDNATAVLAAATHRSNDEIRELVASYAPRLDTPLEVSAQIPVRTSEPTDTPAVDGVSAQTQASDASSTPPASTQPLAPGRYEARFTIGEETREALRKLEALLGRRASSDDIDAALRRGIESIAADIEKRRFGATDRPRKQRKSPKGRYIPAAVKRAVRERDGERCTFVAESGRRCSAHGKLEYDHIVPVARGGKSTPDNLRLRCHAHNQFEAEQIFGAGFMQEKRTRRRAKTPPTSMSTPAPVDPDLDVTPWLRHLGFRAEEAKRAAEQCAHMNGAPIESRVRAALAFLSPRVRRGGALRAPAPVG